MTNEVKNYALKLLQKQIRQDPWTVSVMQASGLQLDQLAEKILTIYNSSFFDRIPLDYIERYEKALGITARAEQTLDDRRAAIEAAWKSSGTLNMQLFQEICNSWKNGEVAVTYTPGVLHLTFNSIFGVPSDLASLKNAVDRVVPCHIVVDYDFRYFLIKEVETMTLAELETKPLNQFAGGN